MIEAQSEYATSEVLPEQNSFPANMPTHEQFSEGLRCLEARADAKGEVSIPRHIGTGVYKLKPADIRATEKLLSDGAATYEGYVSAQWWSWLLQVRTLTFFPLQKYITIEFAKMHGCKNKYPAFRPAELFRSPNNFRGLQNYFPEADFIISMGTQEYFNHRVGKANRRDENPLLPVIESASVTDVKSFCEKAFVEIGGARQMDPALIKYIKKYCLENFETLRFEGLPEAEDFFDHVVDQWSAQLSSSFGELSTERPSMNRDTWDVKEFFSFLEKDSRWFLKFNADDQTYILDRCFAYMREYALNIPDNQMRMVYEELSLVRETPNFIIDSYTGVIRQLIADNFHSNASPMTLKQMPIHARPIFIAQLLRVVQDKIDQDHALRSNLLSCKKGVTVEVLELPAPWRTATITSAIDEFRRQLQYESD